MRRRLLTACLAVLLLGGASCGDGDEAGTATSGDGTDLQLVRAGQLTVCSDIPYEPFEFEGPDGELTGYDIDLMRAVADALDLELNVRTTPFDGILGALEAGACDVVASALTITPERDEQVDFSSPYFDADQSLLIRREDAGRYASLDDLAGRPLGVQAGTTGEQYANESAPEGATVRSFQGAAELFAALEAGEIDAIVQDFPVNAYRAVQDDDVVVTESFPTGEQYGFAVRQGNDVLRRAIDEQLQALRDGGEFDEIYRRYFGAPEQ